MAARTHGEETRRFYCRAYVYNGSAHEEFRDINLQDFRYTEGFDVLHQRTIHPLWTEEGPRFRLASNYIAVERALGIDRTIAPGQITGPLPVENMLYYLDTILAFVFADVIVFIRQVNEISTPYHPSSLDHHEVPDIEESLFIVKKIDYRLGCIIHPKPPADCP